MNTTSLFIKKAQEIHGDTYIYDSSIYIKNNTSIKIECRKHGEFSITPNYHLNGGGCPCCAKEKYTWTTEKLRDKAKALHGDKYEYRELYRDKNILKIRLACPIHGEFTLRIHDHLSGRGCRLCRTYRKNPIKINRQQTRFIVKAQWIHGTKYDYSAVIYEAYDIPVSIQCDVHGAFSVTPRRHVFGQGCPLCSYNTHHSTTYKMTELDKKRRKTFIQKAKSIHGQKYIYSKVIYINSQTKVEIICKKHGSFYQTTSDHLKKSGCPICRSSKGEHLVRCVLTEMGISFKEQQKFNDCRYVYPLVFDFYIPEWNMYIEYHGAQHYTYTPYYHKDETCFSQ